MEQKDYVLREISKIGIIFATILDRILRQGKNLSISPEQQLEAEKSMLLDSINFDMDKFLSLDVENSNRYIAGFDGLNVKNIELLADILSQVGLDTESNNAELYLTKALQLYDFCNLKDKTYSFEREANISKIKDFLEVIPE